MNQSITIQTRDGVVAATMNIANTKRGITLALVVVVVHTALLFIMVPAITSRTGHSYGNAQFPDGYDLLAENLVKGHGYRFYPVTAPTLMREPGYPLLVAGLSLVFKDGFTAVKTLNLVFALCTAVLAVRIAANLMVPDTGRFRQLSLWAPALLFLFHPGVLMAESRGGCELLFASLLTLFVFIVLKANHGQKWWLYAAGGLVLGVTVSVRSTPMLFPFLLLIYLLIAERSRVRPPVAGRNILLMIAAMMTVLSPWIIRNYKLTGKFMPTASVLGVSAQAGQYIGKHEFEGRPFWLLDREAARERDRLAQNLGYGFEDGTEGYYQTFYRTDDEINFSNYLFRRVVTEYRSAPSLLAKCLAQNVFNFWFAGKTWTATAINALVQLPYLFLAGIGTVMMFKRKQAKAVAPILLCIGYLMALHVAILAQARYSIPLFGLISVLASMGLTHIWKSFGLRPMEKNEGQSQNRASISN